MPGTSARSRRINQLIAKRMSGGIGLELAKELANRGYDVVIASAGERLSGAAEEIRSRGHQVIEVHADLAIREDADLLWMQCNRLVVRSILHVSTRESALVVSSMRLISLPN